MRFPLGSTSIVLQFDIDKDMLTAAQDVQEAVSTALPYLPPNIPYGPVYRKVNPAQQPVIILGLTSPTLPRSDLYTYANTLIGQRISMLEGVSQVNTFGSILAVRIQVDPAKLVTHNVTLAEVAGAVQRENVFLPTGQLDGKRLSSRSFLLMENWCMQGIMNRWLWRIGMALPFAFKMLAGPLKASKTMVSSRSIC